LRLPSLRERPEDLVLLFLHFLRRFRPEIAGAAAAERQRLRKVLAAEPFRGNVREMENVVRRFCLLFRPNLVGGEIASLLEACLDRVAPHGSPPASTPSDLKQTMRTTEMAILRDLLEKHRSRVEVCRILGLDRSSLWRKMKKYGLTN
ncbi:MAG: AAA-type ATPase lid domain-containing protein, partial [Syntrophales bacterium]